MNGLLTVLFLLGASATILNGASIQKNTDKDPIVVSKYFEQFGVKLENTYRTVEKSANEWEARMKRDIDDYQIRMNEKLVKRGDTEPRIRDALLEFNTRSEEYEQALALCRINIPCHVLPYVKEGLDAVELELEKFMLQKDSLTLQVAPSFLQFGINSLGQLELQDNTGKHVQEIFPTFVASSEIEEEQSAPSTVSGTRLPVKKYFDRIREQIKKTRIQIVGMTIMWYEMEKDNLEKNKVGMNKRLIARGPFETAVQTQLDEFFKALALVKENEEFCSELGGIFCNYLIMFTQMKDAAEKKLTELMVQKEELLLEINNALVSQATSNIGHLDRQQ